MPRTFVAAFVAALAVLPAPAAAQVYQYAAPAKNVKNEEITAFLWVPPRAERVRGVLVGGMTLMEPEFAKDPLIRRACTEEQLAIVYFFPSLDALFDYKEGGPGRLLQRSLDALAAASGYREIAVAPLFSFGHSVSTIFARNVAFWAPERCFGVLLFKGGMGFPANDPDASAAGVPILLVKGQFEEFGPGPSGVLRDFEDRETAWKGSRDGLLRLRGKDERYLVSLLVEPGATHFAWSEPVARYVAQFIHKAAQRIPDWPVDAERPVRLSPIDPKTGALSSGRIGRPDAEPAVYGDYRGDRSAAFWHLDLELARANDAFHAGMFDKRPQFVTFADPQSGKTILVGHDLRLRLGPTWVGPDTFQVAGTFLDHAPDKYPPADGPVGHAAGPIRFRAFGGAIEQVGPDRFRVAPDGRQRVRGDILAFHPGDRTYRYAEQQGRVGLPERLTKGQPQSITFAEIGRVAASRFPLKLAATSDSGLPVRYYVESGPAAVDGDTLRLADVPARTKYPLEIVVVAYQYGSAVEPLVGSAEPVRRRILVTR
jgi:hypothetical protein